MRPSKIKIFAIAAFLLLRLTFIVGTKGNHKELNCNEFRKKNSHAKKRFDAELSYSLFHMSAGAYATKSGASQKQATLLQKECIERFSLFK